MDENEREMLNQRRMKGENPYYNGVRTKNQLKDKILLGNTERLIEE